MVLCTGVGYEIHGEKVVGMEMGTCRVAVMDWSVVTVVRLS